MSQPAIDILVQVQDEASEVLLGLKKLGIEVAKTFKASNQDTYLDSVEKDSKGASTGLKTVDGAAKQASSSIKLVGKGSGLASVSSDAKKSAASLKAAGSAASSASTQITHIGKINLKGIKSQIDQAKKSIKDLKSESSLATNALSKMAGVLAGITAGVGLAEAVKLSKEFGKSIREVSTLVDTSVTSLDELTESVDDLSTAYGQDSVTTAKAMYQVISAGAEAGAEANAVLETSMRLAIGGATDVTTAVTGIVPVINAYGKSMDEADSVASILFNTVKNGITTIPELSSSLAAVTPIAAQMGVSFEEVAAATAAITKSGVSTSETMTKLTAALSSIASNKESAKVFKDLGFESAQAAIKAKGFQYVVNALNAEAKGSTARMIELTGSIEAVSAVSILGGKGMDDFTENLLTNKEGADSLSEAYDKMSDSAGFKLNQAMSSLSVTMRKVGDVMLPILADVATFVAGVAESIADFASEHKTLSSVLTISFGIILGGWVAIKALGMVSTLLGMGGAFTSLTGAIKANSGAMLASAAGMTSLSGIMAVLGAAVTAVKARFLALFTLIKTNPIGLALTALAIGITLVVDAYSDWKQEQKDVEAAQQSLNDTTLRLANAIEKKTQVLQGQISVLEEYKDVVILTAEEQARLSVQELQDYTWKINKAKEYTDKQMELAQHMKDYGTITKEAYSTAKAESEKYSAALSNISFKMDDMSVEVTKLYYENNKFIKTLEEMGEKGEKTQETLADMFSGMDLTKADDAIQTMVALGDSSVVMADAFKESIQDRTVPEIEHLVATIDEEFKRGTQTLEQHTQQMTTVVEAVFERTGVTMQKDLREMDDIFNREFGIIIESGHTNVEDLTRVIEEGLKDLGTKSGLQALEANLDKLFKNKQIDADLYADSLDRVRVRISELDTDSQKLTRTMEEENAKIEQLIQTYDKERAATDRVNAAKKARYDAAIQLARAQGDEARAAELSVAAMQSEAKAAKEAASAAKGLADAAELAALAMEYQTLVAGTSLTQAQQDAATAAREAADALHEEYEALKLVQAQAESAVSSSEDVATANKGVASSADQASSGMTGLGAAMAAHLNSLGAALGQMSAKAEAYFRVMDEGLKMGADGATTLGKEIEQVETKLQRLQAHRPLGSSVAKWFYDVAIAAAKTEQMFLKQAQSADYLGSRLAGLNIVNAQTADKLDGMISSFELLDDSTLSSLHGQVDGLRSAMESLNGTINSTLSNLQNELARARGNLVEIELTQYYTRMQELEVLLQQAQESRDSNAIARVQEAMAVAEELHNINMNNVREQMIADRNAQAESTARSTIAIDNASTAHSQHIEQVKSDTIEVTNLSLDSEAQVSTIKTTNQATLSESTMQAIREQRDASSTLAKEQHSSAISAIEEEKTQTLNAMNAESSQASSDEEERRSTYVANIDSAHEQNVSHLTSQHTQRMANIGFADIQAREAETAQHTVAIANAQSEYESQIANEDTRHETNVSYATSESESRVRNAASEYDLRIQAMQAEYTAQVTDINSEYELQISNETSRHSSVLDNESERHSVVVSNIQEEADISDARTSSILSDAEEQARAYGDMGDIYASVMADMTSQEDDFHANRMDNLAQYGKALKGFSAAPLDTGQAVTGGSLGGGRTASSGGFGGFAQGGPVSGPISGPGTSTSDSILAWLSNGEWVMDAQTVKYWGRAAMRAMQLMAKRPKPLSFPKLPGFAKGGPVSGPSVSRAMARSSKPTEDAKKIVVELTRGQTAISGTFPASQEDDLLDILSSLQARA